MNGYYVAPGGGEIIYVTYRLGYHKMYIEHERGAPAERFYDRLTEGYVRNENAVHHIEMKIFRTTRGGFFDLCARGGKIAGECGG